MDWLLPAMIMVSVGTFILILLYIYLFLFYRKRHFLIMLFAWIFYELRFLFAILIELRGTSKFLLFGNQVNLWINACLLLWSTLEYLHKKPGFNFAFLFIGIMVWLLVSIMLNLDFLIITLPNLIITGAIFVYIGLEYMFTFRANLGAKVAGISFILWGIHKWDYPFLRNTAEFAPFGFAISTILEFISAIGLLLIYFEIAQYQLGQESQRLMTILLNMGDGVLVSNKENRITFSNKIGAEIFGESRKSIIGKKLDEFGPFQNQSDFINSKYPSNSDKFHFSLDFIHKSIQNNQRIIQQNKCWLIMEKGKNRIISYTLAFLFTKEDKFSGTVLIVRDITESVYFEEEIHKMQNLESIGILAGGIAHDFNNILTTIIGNVSLAKTMLDPSHEVIEVLDDAEKASLRASSLTHQLLTFSKGGAPVLEQGNLMEIIQESLNFILRGSEIAFEMTSQGVIEDVQFDPNQLNQVFNNLTLNSLQAMPNGGKISVLIKKISPEEIPKKNQWIMKKRSYMQIDFSDTGCGIKKKDLLHLFEPYFTTKEKGTGLGLATVYSILKKHKGYIFVDSKENVGTIFSIFLPITKNVDEDLK